MFTIELETELELILQEMAKKQHISINEMIKHLLNTSLKEKQVSKLLIDVAENLPIITYFQDKDPLAIQMALRDEWN